MMSENSSGMIRKRYINAKYSSQTTTMNKLLQQGTFVMCNVCGGERERQERMTASGR